MVLSFDGVGGVGDVVGYEFVVFARGVGGEVGVVFASLVVDSGDVACSYDGFVVAMFV